jgi:hypothetical protein
MTFDLKILNKYSMYTFSLLHYMLAYIPDRT